MLFSDILTTIHPKTAVFGFFYCLFCQIMPHNAKNKGFSALNDKTSCRSFILQQEVSYFMVC